MLEALKSFLSVFILFLSFYCGHRYYLNLLDRQEDTTKKYLKRYGWLLLAFIGVGLANSIS